MSTSAESRALNVTGSFRDGAAKHRRSRHGHGYRRSRSVSPNSTLIDRPPGDGGRTHTIAVATTGDRIIDDAQRATTPIPPEVRLTADVRPTRDGGLKVLVAWDWAILRSSAIARKKASGPRMYEFTIHWARKTCNVDNRLPHCDSPDHYYSNTAWAHGPKVRLGQTPLN